MRAVQILGKIFVFSLMLLLACLRRGAACAKASFKGYKSSLGKSNAFHAAREADAVGTLPCIILVNPYLDQNVGSVARAMLNFGLSSYIYLTSDGYACRVQLHGSYHTYIHSPPSFLPS